MQPGLEQPRPRNKRRRRFLRPLLATLVITCLLTAFAFMLLPRIGKSSGFDEGELKLGSTTFRFELNDDEPREFFQHESWDGRDGELSRGRRITLGLPLGTLEFGYKQEPLEAIRARLPTTVEGLAELLDSRDHFEVFAAAQALVENPEGAVSALPKLIAAAEKNLQLVRAIEGIALCAPKESVPALISGLSSTNKDLRNYYTRIFSSLGTNAISGAPALHAALQSDRIDPGAAAYALIKITGDCSAIMPKVRDELRYASPDQRFLVLHALAEAGPKAASAVPEVLAILKSSGDYRMRARALETLAQIFPDETLLLPHIHAALEFPRSATTVAGINALTRLGAAGVPHLVHLYQSTNIPTRFAAAGALAKIGPPAASASDMIRSELQSSRVDDVWFACKIVANLGTNATELLPTLTNLLFVPNIRIRAYAAITLTRLGHSGDTIARILAESFADQSVASNVYETVQPILKTNAAFKAVFDQRLALNRKAARSYRNHASLFTEEATDRLEHFCSLP